jgi:hypothetical protein
LKNLRSKTLGQIQNLVPHRQVSRLKSKTTPGDIAKRFTLIGNCQLLRVVCNASQFQAQFTLCEEANNDRFFATARRAAKELGQGQKLSQRELRQFKLIPASD